jgi:BioD-like phosphotransacetylase family protein
MPVLLVASSEPRIGRSLIAAALAYRLNRDGHPVTLARLSGDDSAPHDAQTFASLEGIVAPASPVDAQTASSISGDAILEAAAGAVAAAAAHLQARVLCVATATSPPVDAPPSAIAGTVITSVSPSELETVTQRGGVLAVLEEDRVLAAPSVEDIAAALDATWLSRPDDRTGIDRVMIGTVASDAATPYFGNREHTCVITRFDKTDIQLAALQTDLACLVLTGGGEPSPYLLDRVAGHRPDVAVLLAPASTVEAMRDVEDLYRRSRFDGAGKLARAVELLDEAGVDLDL